MNEREEDITLDLTLPADVCRGIIRRCSPVVITGEYMRKDRSLFTAHRRSVVLVASGYTVDVWPRLTIVPALREVHLDLADETGRMHACRWIAQHFWPKAVGPAYLWAMGEGRWSLRCWITHQGGQDFKTFRASGSPEPGPTRPEVPGLAALDPEDTRLLPDGSRWVDAEALRIIALHVATTTARSDAV